VPPGGKTGYITREERLSRYYLRLHTDDRPGILAQIGAVLAKHDISLTSVIQKELHADPVPLVFMTHQAREEGILKAINEISGFDFVHGDVMLIRVEDTLQ
jgi:homoserine dehydrogenase